jgi:hypothetical protein
MTLAELSKAWQSLRDALVGRSGNEKHASAELLARFKDLYAQWRQWYEQAGIADDATGSIGGAEPHIVNLRALTAYARAEGLRPSFELPKTPGERLDVGLYNAKWLAAGALALAAAFVFTRGRR